jgi:DNA-binding IclR family transcriptional regulator
MHADKYPQVFPGSMQAAAKALGVNQSTVQRRIAELEECVGHRLVERHLGSYRLTALGLSSGCRSPNAALAPARFFQNA